MQEIIAFQAAIANSGLGNPDIIPDGSIHRFHCEGDKPGRRNGWYICYQDTSGTGGAFGSWRTGERHTWFSRGERVSRAERDHLRTLLAAERKRRGEIRPFSPEQIDPWLELVKSEFKPGQSINVKFGAPSTFTEFAWIGIVPADTQHGDEDRNRLAAGVLESVYVL